jgi:hypothetical protein
MLPKRCQQDQIDHEQDHLRLPQVRHVPRDLQGRGQLLHQGRAGVPQGEAMSERDKFLTEAMGECWHEWSEDCKQVGEECNEWEYTCTKCKQKGHEHEFTGFYPEENNFSTWADFGKLWEWAQTQEWFYQFTQYTHGEDSYLTEQYNCFWDLWNSFFKEYANPDRFANALYEFLKARTP